MSTREAVRAGNRIRVLRVAMVPFLAWNLALAALDSAAGRYLLVLVNVACVLTLVGVVALQTCLIGRIEKHGGARGSLPEAALRRIAGRSRMTPEDYEHLRELEAELGWEPSEPCAPVDLPERRPTPTPRRGTGTLTATGKVSLADGPALSGTGSLSAVRNGLGGVWSTAGSRFCRCLDPARRLVQVQPLNPAFPSVTMCAACGRRVEQHAPATRAAWDDVAYASEASEHFAAPARVGLEHCISPCPMCDEQGHRHATLPAALRETTIATMEPGRPYYAVPWAMQAGEDGRMWLRAGYTASARRGGTVRMRVERRPDGYHVWPVPGEEYAPGVTDGHQFVLVSVLEGER